MKKTNESATPYPDPPAHLSERSQGLWNSIGPARCRSLERQTLFLAALEALDRSDEARRIVAVEGMTTVTETTKAVHIHPLLRVERESKQQFTRIWTELHLAWNHDIDSKI